MCKLFHFVVLPTQFRLTNRASQESIRRPNSDSLQTVKILNFIYRFWNNTGRSSKYGDPCSLWSSCSLPARPKALSSKEQATPGGGSSSGTRGPICGDWCFAMNEHSYRTNLSGSTQAQIKAHAEGPINRTSRAPVPLTYSHNMIGKRMARLSVAIIDDDASVLNNARTILSEEQYDVATYDSGRQALQCLQNGSRPKIVLVASELPDIDSVDLIRQIRQINVHSCVVVMSNLDKLGELVAAIRQGARTVLRKPFLPDEILKVISQLTTENDAHPAVDGVEVQVGDHLSMVYASSVMQEIQQQAALVARVNLPVLILGESGTGKEVMARYIHSQSNRAKNTFLKVNCAAVPSELLESELFGYESGAFTGAGRSKPGKFKLCHEGTMFLDEIGEMHPSLQAKLLQVLQDGTFCPLGSRVTERVNVRIIAATNINMKMAIANRTFREDLYYRLNGFCVQLPPLRERREDIPSLLHYFLRRYSYELGLLDVQPSLPARLAKTCLRYDWPGNLRELESFVKRYLVLGDEQQMIDELTREMDDRRQSTEITAEAIHQALRLSAGNRTMAAKALGISYKVLLHRLRLYGIEPAPQNAWLV